MSMPASLAFSAPPRKISASTSASSDSSGKPTMLSAVRGRPPIAYTSLSALAAATVPNVYGSSTMGVKKSVVSTRATSSERRYTAASSAVALPTSTFVSVTLGSRPRSGNK